MLATIIGGILSRDIKAVRRELEAYADEGQMWATPPGISNSAGTLALHLTGNLRSYIGSELGGISYVRDRDAEFSRRDVPHAELLEGLNAALSAVEATLPKLTADDFAKSFPVAVGGATINTGDFLLHLIAHLTYHAGQIDYHRRVVTGQAGRIAAVMPTELSSARKNA